MDMPRDPAYAVAPLAPVAAPVLPPAAVLHGGGEGVDGLLESFAAALAARGFRIGGVVQRTGCGDGACAAPMELVDLATGRVMPISQKLGRGSSSCRVDPAGVAEAAPMLRAALAAGVDLLVVNKFGALEASGGGLAAEIAEATAAGVPVLTSVNGKHLGAFLAYGGDLVRLLPPDPAALWRWWGGCRLYDDLLHPVEDAPVRRILCRPPWILVLAEAHGRPSAGLARLPAGGAPPDTAALAALAAGGLRRLAEGLAGWDPFRAALAVAALNLHHNAVALAAADGVPGAAALEPGNGLDLLAREAAGEGGRLVVIGSFPGVRDRLPGAQVIDARPGPGEYPAEAAEWLLPGAAAVAITAASLANRTLPRLLQLAAGARVALVGPSTPLSDRLFAYGIDRLAGFVVDDPEGLAVAVAEGAGPRGWTRFGRQVVLRRGPVVGRVEAAADGAAPLLTRASGRV
ncbi:DUF2478 domain-containing protein [Arenibaculum pallidiluteum]|uniref:DUF2478 domain-containing protein n=1 Tax=Arenibaculum pallidiluteum TaxID=2812559 RepID=UPI001A972BB8|nr:DUF2478 domain-containing protein [Arenibaculum pallidiluteum]